MNYNSFNVPTLSLSTSRSRKLFTQIPTKDQSAVPSNLHPSRADYMRQLNPPLSNPNNSSSALEKNKKGAIFPPKAPSAYSGQIGAPSSIDNSQKDINKNVYLQRYQQDSPQVKEVSHLPRPGDFLPSSRGGLSNNIISQFNQPTQLLGNPISSRIVQDEIAQRSLNRKAQISKVLFEKRISKLLQQAKFYDQQFTNIAKDDVTSHLNDLQNLKQQSLSKHRQLLEGLTALIQ